MENILRKKLEASAASGKEEGDGRKRNEAFSWRCGPTVQSQSEAAAIRNLHAKKQSYKEKIFCEPENMLSVLIAFS